jgi:heptosyltransferase-2
MSSYRLDCAVTPKKSPKDMNMNSIHESPVQEKDDTRPLLVVPYMWIGDFVRGHTVVRVLKQRWPNRPIDMLATSLFAPLVDYMPGVRSGIVWDLPRSRLAVAMQWELAAQLRARNYGTAIVLPRTWKSAIAPALAGSGTVGFVGGQIGLINLWRWGERPCRFIGKNAALALPEGTPVPPEWPVPQLMFRPAERWRKERAGHRCCVALAPGSVGASRDLCGGRAAIGRIWTDVWVIGGPAKRAGRGNHAAGGPRVRDHRYRSAQLFCDGSR